MRSTARKRGHRSRSDADAVLLRVEGVPGAAFLTIGRQVFDVTAERLRRVSAYESAVPDWDIVATLFALPNRCGLVVVLHLMSVGARKHEKTQFRDIIVHSR